MSRQRHRRSRLLALLVLLVLLEGALQLAAPLIQVAMSRAPERADPDSPLTVLCVGDSNTYGLHLPQIYAYPALLGADLDRRYRHPVSVVNRGVPGQGSAQVAAHLPADLAAVQPDLVLLLAGINDTWNTDGRDLGWAGWLGRLRLVRLLRVLTAGVTTAASFEVTTDAQGRIVVDRGEGARPVNAGEGSAGTLEGESLRAAVRQGLARGIALCRDHGALPVLLTYAEGSGPFAVVNDAIRVLALEQDVLLIDIGRAFEAHFAELGYDTLMFGDHHPNLLGYRLMASDVARALEAAGLVPPPLPDAERPRSEQPPPQAPPQLALEADGSIGLSGPAGWVWQLVVSHLPEPGDGFDAGDVRIPLPPDDVLAAARLDPSLSGRFDGSGRARAHIAPPLRALAAGTPLAACLLLLRDDPGPDATSAVAAISEVLELP